MMKQQPCTCTLLNSIAVLPDAARGNQLKLQVAASCAMAKGSKGLTRVVATYARHL
jgi:hypothetical protein